jgi:asparagine N-glycosylation enzyme membrane subunit Stt3
MGIRTPYNFFVVSVLAISLVFIVFRSLQKREVLLLLPVIFSMTYMGFSEQKYLLHFAPAYAIAFSIVVAEALNLIDRSLKDANVKDKEYFLYGFLFIVAFFQGIFPAKDTLTMIYYILLQQQPNCNSISQGDIITYNNFCMTIPDYWLNSMEWIKNNSGPNGPRTLSWWDYGHWINWFGNSNAVLRNDNAFPEMDYNVAALFIMTSSDGFGPKALEEYMNKVQAKYILLDQDLILKWGALNFLGCVFANRTNMSFAFQQGEKQGVPYAIGTSKCEEEHSPVYVLIPLNITSTSQFCSTNSIKVYTTNSQIFCFKPSNYQYNQTSIGEFFTQTGRKVNAIAPQAFCTTQKTGDLYYYQCMLLYYSPNDPTATKYYNSTFYKLFFMGNLSGFKQVFPSESEVLDLGNGLSFAPVRIFELINYTGGNVTHQILPNQKFQVP